LRLRLKEPMDGSSLIFCGIEFQIVGAANLKALRPTALAVKGTCNRLSEAKVKVRGLTNRRDVLVECNVTIKGNSKCLNGGRYRDGRPSDVDGRHWWE